MIDGGTRRARFAGSFYESDPQALRNNIRALMSGSKRSGGKFVQAMIVPHAGYMYSGRIAARTFARASDTAYSRILLIAPSHRSAFSGLAYSTFEEYETPIGSLKVDKDALSELVSSGNPWISKLNLAHKEEHSLEVELPFLIQLFPNSKLLPFVCGRLDESICKTISQSLSQYLAQDTLWVLSSDFTHYGASFGYVPFTSNLPERIKDLDMGAVGRILQLDYEGFSDYIEKTGATICGVNPIKLLLMSMRLAGTPHRQIAPELVEYSNSGEMTGDFHHCVGYAGIVFNLIKMQS